MLSRTSRRVMAVLAAASMLGITSCSDFGDDAEETAGGPGSLVTERTLTGTAALPSASRTHLITYLSDGADRAPPSFRARSRSPREKHPPEAGP